MRLSKALIKTTKSRSQSEELLSVKLLIQSGILIPYESGIFAKNTPWVRAHAKLSNIIRNVLDKYDCAEVELPILQPCKIWEESGRLQKYLNKNEIFCFQRPDNPNGDLCFAPTAEEAAAKVFQRFAKSYKDLPVCIHQISTKARNEIRPHGGYMRAIEFEMSDAYSAHASEESMKEKYQAMEQAYFEIFRNLGLDITTSEASNGDMGGKVSKEFLLHCEKGNCCIELGHIFQLGQSISAPMKATFRNSCDFDIPYYMGCYGIGTSRTLMAILETTCDDEGLCWPESIAPYKVMIIYKRDKEELASKLYHELLDADVEVVLDDREGLSIGSKIKDWKLFGFPYLIMIGDKTSADSEVFEVESRKDGNKTFLKKSELLSFLK